MFCPHTGHSRGHFTTFCPLERHPRGHFELFCPLEGHLEGTFACLTDPPPQKPPVKTAESEANAANISPGTPAADSAATGELTQEMMVNIYCMM